MSQTENSNNTVFQVKCSWLHISQIWNTVCSIFISHLQPCNHKYTWVLV